MFKKILLPIWFVVGLVFVACQSQPPTPPPAASPVAQLPTATATFTAVAQLPTTAVTFTAVPPIITPTSNPTSKSNDPQREAVTPRPRPIETPQTTSTPQPTLTSAYLATLEPIQLATVEPPAPTQLTLVAQEGGSLTSMAVENGRLYTNEGAQLVVVDVSDPTKPQVVGRSQFLPFIPHYMVALNGVLYVGAGTQLQVWDVKNPAGLILLHHYQLPGYIENLWNTNQQIWLYWQPNQTPKPVLSQLVEGQLINSIELDNPALQLKGQTLWYLNGDTTQNTIWQLSLTEKRIQAVLTVPFGIADFAFYGSELHLISYQNKWNVYEQTSAGWQFKREIEAEWGLPVEDIEVIGSFIYIVDRFCEGGCSGDVSVYELTPTGVQFLSKTAKTYRHAIVYEGNFYLQHDHDISFLAWENGEWVKTGLFGARGIVDSVLITDNYLWQLRNGGLIQSLLVNGLPIATTGRPFYYYYRDQATLTASEQYIIAVNPDVGVVLVPLAPLTTTVEAYHIPQYAGLKAQQQDTLLAVLTFGGIKIWDITEFITPTLLGDLPSLNTFSINSFLWGKSTIYTMQNTDDAKTLTAWDLTIPAKPMLLGELVLEEAGYLITHFPDILYLSTSTELLVVDVSNPAEMNITYRLSLGYQLGEMSVHNGRGYSLQGNLSIFDLSNPAEPQLLIKVSSPLLRADSFPYPVANLAVGEQYIYVAAGDAGLLVFEQP